MKYFFGIFYFIFCLYALTFGQNIKLNNIIQITTDDTLFIRNLLLDNNYQVLYYNEFNAHNTSSVSINKLNLKNNLTTRIITLNKIFNLKPIYSNYDTIIVYCENTNSCLYIITLSDTSNIQKIKLENVFDENIMYNNGILYGINNKKLYSRKLHDENLKIIKTLPNDFSTGFFSENTAKLYEIKNINNKLTLNIYGIFTNKVQNIIFNKVITNDSNYNIKIIDDNHLIIFSSEENMVSNIYLVNIKDRKIDNIPFNKGEILDASYNKNDGILYMTVAYKSLFTNYHTVIVDTKRIFRIESDLTSDVFCIQLKLN